jgi:hypothetical protein
VSAGSPGGQGWGIRLVTFYHWFVPAQLRTASGPAVGGRLRAAHRRGERRQPVAVRPPPVEGDRGVDRDGASRARLIRQMLVESLCSPARRCRGLLAAMWAIDAIDAIMPPNLPVPGIHVDSSVLLFALAATVAIGLFLRPGPGVAGIEGRSERR